MTELPASLLSWAGRPGSRLLLGGARRLLEAGRTGSRTLVRVELNGDARRDVGRLLGLDWQASGRAVSLGRLERAVAEAGGELGALLERVGGPLRDLPSERSALAEERTGRRAAAAQLLVEAGVPKSVAELALARRWLGGPESEELLARTQALALLLHRLPANGALLATVASDVFGDPHALDRSRPLGRAAVRVLAASHAGDADRVAAVEQSAGAAGWRRTWAAVGVVCDQLSSTVLALNVGYGGSGTAVDLLRAGACVGEPVWLTARSLTGSRFAAPAGAATVFVCENPSVVESAADRLGHACPPLVCTYGRPSTATWLLLDALAAAGARFLVTGDRDVDGSSITADLLDRYPTAQPWLPEAAGVYEEERLPLLLRDLAAGAEACP